MELKQSVFDYMVTDLFLRRSRAVLRYLDLTIKKGNFRIPIVLYLLRLNACAIVAVTDVAGDFCRVAGNVDIDGITAKRNVILRESDIV